jgi:hypothetical protein
MLGRRSKLDNVPTHRYDLQTCMDKILGARYKAIEELEAHGFINNHVKALAFKRDFQKEIQKTFDARLRETLQQASLLW